MLVTIQTVHEKEKSKTKFFHRTMPEESSITSLRTIAITIINVDSKPLYMNKPKMVLDRETTRMFLNLLLLSRSIVTTHVLR